MAKKEIHTDLSPKMKYYTDGTVDRLFTTPYVPPSPLGDADGISTKDVIISPTLSARLYLPLKHKQAANSTKFPIIVYYHGGGFCLASAFTSLDHNYVKSLTSITSALIVSVEYRLAPEHPIPVAYHDSWDALLWTCTPNSNHPWLAEYGDLNKLYIAGDSAGGNIVHHMAVRAVKESLPGNVGIKGAILSHPFFMGSDDVKGESIVFLEKMWKLACPNGGIDSEWMNPVGDEGWRGRLGCGKIQIWVSEKDELRGKGLAYAEKLKKSGGCQVEVVEIEGEGHCFQLFAPDSDKALYLLNKAAVFISQELN